ncbi:MAG: FAD-binding protein, partial [Lachnospiraceae bacterium]|nr:FAD-binding protein [Lachnospiraceae bacterium]
LALRAGAALQNMTEWQYGLASVAPRWNVSGTYMQVLPRFVSVDEDGEEREFLFEFFADEYEALSKVFLKGYQWPFDVKKAYDGSSVIDLLVYRETVLRKRRVYLDFTRNPFKSESIAFERLHTEAYEYLNAAGACFGTPIERLEKMNAPAIELYASKGVDLRKDYLEIALCAQHNNGGIAVDAWWQTNITGLFAVGECAGTHGITRPGGSALNAGQVGSLRAAQFISASGRTVNSGVSPMADAGKGTKEIIRAAILRHEKLLACALENSDNVDEALKKVRQRMSDCGGAIRDICKMREAYDEVHNELTQFSSLFGVKSELELVKLYRLRDALTVQLAALGAMIDYAEKVKVSRGSALYYDKAGELQSGLEEMFRFSTTNMEKTGRRIQQVEVKNGELEISWRAVRPMPEDNDFFETVWKRYREDRNIY